MRWEMALLVPEGGLCGRLREIVLTNVRQCGRPGLAEALTPNEGAMVNRVSTAAGERLR